VLQKLVRESGKNATTRNATTRNATTRTTRIMTTIPAMKRTNLPLLLNHHHRHLSKYQRTLDTRKHKALKADLYQLLRAGRLRVSKGDPHQIPLRWLAMLLKYEQNSRRNDFESHPTRTSQVDRTTVEVYLSHVGWYSSFKRPWTDIGIREIVLDAVQIENCTVHGAIPRTDMNPNLEEIGFAHG
jgi:hypothetical protein